MTDVGYSPRHHLPPCSPKFVTFEPLVTPKKTRRSSPFSHLFTFPSCSSQPRARAQSASHRTTHRASVEEIAVIPMYPRVQRQENGLSAVMPLRHLHTHTSLPQNRILCPAPSRHGSARRKPSQSCSSWWRRNSHHLRHRPRLLTINRSVVVRFLILILFRHRPHLLTINRSAAVKTPDPHPRRHQ